MQNPQCYEPEVTWIAIGKWWRACNSRAHAVDVSASCNNSLKTYLFRFTTHLAHFEETMIHIFLWKILSVPLSNSLAKSCCVIQIFVAILWVTIHVTLHRVGGKTTWRSMLCKWPRTNEERDLSLIRSDLRQWSLC